MQIFAFFNIRKKYGYKFMLSYDYNIHVFKADNEGKYIIL